MQRGVSPQNKRSLPRQRQSWYGLNKEEAVAEVEGVVVAVVRLVAPRRKESAHNFCWYILYSSISIKLFDQNSICLK